MNKPSKERHMDTENREWIHWKMLGKKEMGKWVNFMMTNINFWWQMCYTTFRSRNRMLYT